MSVTDEGPNVWGPRKWYFLHTFAIAYPDVPSARDQDAARHTLRDFVLTLPCPSCREHAGKYFRENPPALASSESLQLWAWRFHNFVNQRLGKPQMSVQSYMATYASERAHSLYGRRVD